MPRIDRLKCAAEEVMSAALLGDGWEAALSSLSCAADAHGAVLLRNRDHKLIAHVSTPDVAWAVSDFLAGRTPPNSRQVRAVPSPDRGFRVDHDDYTPEQLARDPIYQDYLRPHGFFWHANAGLMRQDGDEIALSFKRREKTGHFERQDAQRFNVILAELRASIRVAARVLDAQALGAARLLHERGDPVLELDSWGRVLRAHGVDEGEQAPLRVIGRRLVPHDRLTQPLLDRAVAAALGLSGRVGLVELSAPAGERCHLQLIPVKGRARGVFGAAAALAVLIRADAERAFTRLDPGLIREGLRLTDREACIAALVGEGLSLAEAARELRVQVGTARNHLKSVFEKTGTSRQSQLVALLGRLRG
jgi:DNA-binding CsgD family transcriptional regulator